MHFELSVGMCNNMLDMRLHTLRPYHYCVYAALAEGQHLLNRMLTACEAHGKTLR